MKSEQIYVQLKPQYRHLHLQLKTKYIHLHLHLKTQYRYLHLHLQNHSEIITNIYEHVCTNKGYHNIVSE